MSYSWNEPDDRYDPQPETDERIDEIIEDEMLAANDWNPEDDADFATWLDDQEARFEAEHGADAH